MNEVFHDCYHPDDEQDDFYDCFLSERELHDFLTPTADKWDDVDPISVMPNLTIDKSKEIQWDLAQEEITFVLNRLNEIIGCTEEDSVEIKTRRLIDHVIGDQSEIGNFLQSILEISRTEYLEFMITLVVQAAYRITSSQLYDSQSLLSREVPMAESRYNEIWLKLATLKKTEAHERFVAAGRRDKCIWEKMEEIVNELCRSVSITNRSGKISIALDDDKIWVALTGRNSVDFFGLKYTRHVKANRNGFVAHTAVSTGANIPLGIIFERTKDSTFDCFSRILKFLFERNGVCDLRNVLVASDRGYMVPNTVFNFLIANGADFVGTVKRMANCWPFTFDQKVKEGDKRRMIDTKGPPTLFVKKNEKHIKKVYAIAFRNGTNSVSTAISSVHRGHHWEGIALFKRELNEYEEDKSSLQPKSFQGVKSDVLNQDETDEEKERIENLQLFKVDPITLRQGKS